MNYEEMWNALKNEITDKAKRPTLNSRTVVKHAEEIARKQALFDILQKMENIEKQYSSKNTKNDKYAL